MDGNDLARWTRFAAKGGIGKCTALQDCVAQGADDLMFLKGDEVVVLLQLPQEDQYLGYCEGVVGRFHGAAVRFHGKLKKPVFAKRQSATGSSPSRPMSHSSNPPPPHYLPPTSNSNAKTLSPPPFSIQVPPLISTSPSDAKHTRPSVPSVSPPISRRSQSHSRTASTTSSSSHYSTQSRSSSHPPEPLPVHTHARTHSTASSVAADPPIRPTSDAGSEETQLISLPVKPSLGTSGITTTPALTEASSAHSSFLLTPTPAMANFSPAPHKGTPSLLQGRALSSEKLSLRDETRGTRRRFDNEHFTAHARRAGEDRWSEAEAGAMQDAAVQEKPRGGDIMGKSETSFKSMSLYSEASDMFTNGRMSSMHSEAGEILREDESDGEIFRAGNRSSTISDLSNVSDGRFGIGMTLLREDDDDPDSEYEDEDQEDEETAIGHVIPAKLAEEEDPHSPKTPRTLGMRVMNPSSTTSSISEGSEDMKVISDPHDQSHVRSISKSTSPPTFTRTLDFPTSSSSETSVPKPPTTRPPLLNHGSSLTIASHRPSSMAMTEDEHWESDADIYDDYRYSSASPGQHSSRQASRASSKSTRSRVNSRPPLPDEETWRRGEDGPPPHRSLGGEHSGSGTDPSQESRPDGPSTRPSPLFRVSGTSNAASRDLSSRHRSSSPPQSLDEVVAKPHVQSTVAMNTSSPLTRAFRQSDESVYSRQSQEREDDDSLERVSRSDETATYPTLPRPSPEPERRKTEGDEPFRSKSPALASSLREKIQTESRSKNSNSPPAVPSQLSVLTSRPADEPSVIVLNDSPVDEEFSDDNHLRVGSPQSYSGSAPPSPLNPGFPPSPSSMASFLPTAPLTINKTLSPITPRNPASLPAIPFAGVPPPGRPPTHMQYAKQQFPHLQNPHSGQQHSGQGKLPHSESLHSALRMAGQQRATTIHGHVQTELLTATGPVPISFLLPGMLPPRPQPAAPQMPYGQFQSQNQNQTQTPLSEIQSPRTSSPQPQRQALAPDYTHNIQPQLAATMQSSRRQMTAPALFSGAKASLSITVPSLSSPPPADAYRAHSPLGVQPSEHNAVPLPPLSPSTGTPLPRANFFPKVSKARPRSRSFSGFKSEITEKISQSLGRRSQEEGSQPFMAPTKVSPPDSLSLKTPTKPVPASPLMPTRGRPGQPLRPSHGPSPLSLPPTTNNSPTSLHSTHGNVPPSPISRVTPSTMRSFDIQEPPTKRSALRQTSLHVSQSTTSGPSSVTFPLQRRDSGLNGTNTDDSGSFRPSPPARKSQESDRTHNSFTRSDMSSPPPISTSSPTSSPLVKSSSLRSKISISVLRGKGASRSIRDGGPETPSTTNGPVTPTDEDTVQIKDMEFELIRPTVVRGSSDLHRNEENAGLKEGTATRSVDLRHDLSGMRLETRSPGGLSSSTDIRHGTASTPPPEANGKKGKAVDPNNFVQAHRDRELKWVSLINSGDAAQARKSKKIKKLLIDGVPSSVRYLVWAYLSNSGSKKMPNVYAQLSKRRPALARDIERDVEESFPDHQTLRDPNGPLVSVLYAYIAMVPDLRYSRGLAIIAGNLLLQSPEEDAFWIFLAMMDGYLRLYFMPTSPQMGIDTTLFIKALEAADAQLAKRVFLELNVRPQDLCGVWFSSVFAGSLPLGHLHRVWDLFFYEGIPFLFRVGITILSLTRHHLFESSEISPQSYTAYLLRPPPEDLPTDPEQFIYQVQSVKLKDDDIRKMRLKMTDAAFKQQRAPRVSTSQSGGNFHRNLHEQRPRAL